MDNLDLFVTDRDQTKPVARGCFGRLSAIADRDQSACDVPYHLVQKSVGSDRNMDQVPFLADSQVCHGPHRIFDP